MQVTFAYVKLRVSDRPLPSCGGHGTSRGGRLEPAVECLSSASTPRDPGLPDPHNIPGADGLTDYQKWGRAWAAGTQA